MIIRIEGIQSQQNWYDRVPGTECLVTTVDPAKKIKDRNGGSNGGYSVDLRTTDRPDLLFRLFDDGKGNQFIFPNGHPVPEVNEVIWKEVSEESDQ